MFRYFYRIWDKFRYKYDDKSEIVAAAIYTYKGERGKDVKYVYKLPQIESEILLYNFRTIDVEKINLDKISNDNPLKLVFKMAKSLLKTKPNDEDIYEAKITLAKELANYNKVKNNDQIKALVDFLEYLFLIEDPELESKYDDYKREIGGALKMTIDQIRKIHYKEEGREEGIRESIMDLLSDVGNVNDVLQDKIKSQSDIEILKKWNKIAARSNSIEEFSEKIKEHC